jgi:CBS domain-containing protein
MKSLDQWGNEVERVISAIYSTHVLRQYRAHLHDQLQSELAQGNSANYVARVNLMHDVLTKQTIAMAEERVRESYDSFPVSSYAFVVYGSGGRQEQTLWSDQDNGLIYVAREDVDPQTIETFLTLLGQTIQLLLTEVGYPPCEGNVLVTNPVWRKSIDEWQGTYRHYFANPTFDTVRKLLISADARVIYGDSHVLESLTSEFFAQLKQHPNMCARMLSNTLRYKMLVGLFGHLLTEPYGIDTGGIDLKYGAYLPMVNAIRLMALTHSIAATATLERIRQLRERRACSDIQASEWEQAFVTVLKYRSMTSFQMEQGTYVNRGVLPAKMLTKEVRRELKEAFQIGNELQKWVKRLYGKEEQR